MKLSFNSKAQEIGIDGSVAGTRVTLTNNEGGFLPVLLPADNIDLSNAELEKLALDVVYAENFPQRVENEKFAEITAEMKQTNEDAAVAQATLLDLLTKLYEQGVLTDEISEKN